MAGRLPLAVGLVFLLLAAACSNKSVAPVPGVDLSAYLILPGAGFVKFYSDGSSQTYLQDSVVEGFDAIDLLYGTGAHEYFRKSDRAWIATLDTAATLFILQPPLAAIPLRLPVGTAVAAQSSFATQSGPIPVRRVSILADTGLSETVPAGTFDSVVLIRQEFLLFGTNGLGIPDTSVDSAYRWFAPGVDEIRQVRWRDGEVDSTLREFLGGTVNGVTYP